tara:strand:- start:1273 stop:2061 length:789 start_codon:yes stop_codon:yes gene_type:complete
MAATSTYAPWAVVLGASSQGFEADSIAIGGDHRFDDLQSGAALNKDLRQVVASRPTVDVTLLDPSFLTVWTEVGAGKPIPSIDVVHRAYEEQGGFSTTYKSVSFAQGVIYPVRLSADRQNAARLQCKFESTFAGGNACTVGVASAAAATLSAAYYITHLIIGGDTITAIESADVTWNHTVEDDGQTEPTYLYYSALNLSGTARILDAGVLSEAGIEGGSEHSITLRITDANAGGTFDVVLGNCHVTRGLDGGRTSVTFDQVS